MGGGGTRQVTFPVLPELSVAAITASPGPTWKCLIFSGPMVLTNFTPDCPRTCVILIVSPFAKLKLPSMMAGAAVHASLAETL